MEGSEQDTMDGESKIERAVAVGPLHDAQRLRPCYDTTGAGDATEALRSSLIAATVEVLAEGVSNPRLVETRAMRTAA
jgi:hypothetical protein